VGKRRAQIRRNDDLLNGLANFDEPCGAGLWMRLELPLLVAGQAGEAVGEGVGDAEFHEGSADDLMDGSGR
jgi:hypothetical protein